MIKTVQIQVSPEQAQKKVLLKKKVSNDFNINKLREAWEKAANEQWEK